MVAPATKTEPDSSQPIRTRSRGGCGVVGRYSSIRRAPHDGHFLENDDPRARPPPVKVRRDSGRGGRNQLVQIQQRCRRHGAPAARVIRQSSQARRRWSLSTQHPSNPRCNAPFLAEPLGHSEHPESLRMVRAPSSPRLPAPPVGSLLWEHAPSSLRIGRACPKLLACLEPRCNGNASATSFRPTKWLAVATRMFADVGLWRVQRWTDARKHLVAGEAVTEAATRNQGWAGC